MKKQTFINTKIQKNKIQNTKININYLPEKPNFIKSDIKVTIGILVSNHIQYIRKGMEAIKPLLESVPSELIVVDTVGPENSDGSLDVVKEYTDKIYHFDWINDFSAARNVAMEHARGEWFLYFDDDEYFDDVTEFIDFFNSGECEKYNYCLYYTGDYTRPDHYEKAIAGRLIRRTPNTRFIGIIHEIFNEAYNPIKQFNVFTHHYGYLYTTPEQQEAKTRRNLSLLEKDIAENGPNVKTCAQIVQEYMVFDEVEGGKKCNEYLKIFENTEELEKSPGQWLILANVRFMAQWKSLEGILALEKDILERYHLKETARLVLASQVAVVAFYNSNYEIAADRIKKYFEMYDWLMEHESERCSQVQLDFPKFFMEDKLFSITKAGIVCGIQLKDYETAYSYIKRLDYRYCKNFEEIRSIIEIVLRELKDLTPALEYYKKIYKNEFFE
ncbi:glycosyltransferase, partial [Ruminococcus sp.]|uniref:glycosyltransferase n=1 Tax=Ruminococcus sp. TaxID=41978 RepID=UPI002582C1CD